MVRKTSRKISYLLASDSSHNGHTLGVNSIAVDPNPSGAISGMLYTAGRDGMVMSWELEQMNLRTPPYISIDDLDSAALNTVAEEEPAEAAPPAASANADSAPSTNGTGTNKPVGKSTFRSKIQLHTHWVNDIALVNNYQSVISCSSDLTVKLWNPRTDAQSTIGHHHDFVKCLAVESQTADWVASGSLDRKVILWDINCGGEKLQIDVGNKGNNSKGSVYALGIGGAGGSIIGSGGPDSIVRLWDQRNGESIVNFVGHTDNIRSILVNKAGNLVLTASSDSTIKLWSITAGRLMHTLNMHDSSVWSLHSDHPNLEVFHSSDRSGMVVKTDMRGISEAEDSLSVLVCNEHQGVSKVVASGDYLWTATANSRIHRWRDVDTTSTTIHTQRQQRMRRRSSASFLQPPPQSTSLLRQAAAANIAPSQIPAASLINLNGGFNSALDVADDAASVNGTIINHSLHRSDSNSTSTNAAGLSAGAAAADPLRHNPEETIEGQTGLIKHILLNDRRRVLTVDTAGEVMLWDLVKCVMVKSFGSRDIEDVADEINTFETMTNWCQVNTRTGQLSVVLEESYVFDAEIYADEIVSELPPQPQAPQGGQIEFRDDQRINVGKWILRNLFANLIETEIKRDDEYRQTKRRQIIESQQNGAMRRVPPGQLSFSQMTPWSEGPRTAGANGSSIPLQTPGLVIGLATPAPAYNPNGGHQLLNGDDGKNALSPVNGTVVTDYFSSAVPVPQVSAPAAAALSNTPAASDLAFPSTDATPTSPINGTNNIDSNGDAGDNLSSSSSLMGRLRSFGKGKLSRTASMAESRGVDGPNGAAAAGGAAGASGAGADGVLTPVEEAKNEPAYEDTLAGVLQKVRHEYDKSESYSTSGITVSPASETPIVRLPAETAIIISEQRVDAGGTVDLYRGTVASCGKGDDVGILEDAAPGWLAEFLLLNKIPNKELVKVSFVLQPYEDKLPALPNGNARLNAYRMLRAKKILGYVEEKLDGAQVPEKGKHSRPEEWLELVCQGQVLDNVYTLATIRARIWRQGGDVLLLYRRKQKA